MAWAVVAHGQGTLEFQNINLAAGVNAPVYESDGVTKVSGSQFMAGLGLSEWMLTHLPAAVRAVPFQIDHEPTHGYQSALLQR